MIGWFGSVRVLEPSVDCAIPRYHCGYRSNRHSHRSACCLRWHRLCVLCVCVCNKLKTKFGVIRSANTKRKTGACVEDG